MAATAAAAAAATSAELRPATTCHRSNIRNCCKQITLSADQSTTDNCPKKSQFNCDVPAPPPATPFPFGPFSLIDTTATACFFRLFYFYCYCCAVREGSRGRRGVASPKSCLALCWLHCSVFFFFLCWWLLMCSSSNHDNSNKTEH